MNIEFLEKLGSDASLQSTRAISHFEQEKVTKWCLMFLDDTEDLDVNEEVQGDSETQLH